MTDRSLSAVVLTLTAVTVAAAGCSTTEGKPQAAASRSEAATTTSARPAAPSESAPATPSGQPVGTATMQVIGAGPVTIRYQINGGAEQTEANVMLPWEKQYPVYDKIQSSVTADGGDAGLTCSIVMDGNLVTFKSEPRPTCSFAYYG